MAHKRRTSKTNAKGRRKGNGAFTLIYDAMQASLAWQTLSPSAKATFLEMNRYYKGTNNGEISFSCRQTAKAYLGSLGRAKNVLSELELHGFIKMNNKGHFGNRHATTWILTTQEYNNQPATNDWKRYIPSDEQMRKLRRYEF